jgi:hypothetical protein
MFRFAYPASSVTSVLPYRAATIQYIFMCCVTVAALPSQNVEHVSIVILTVQYVSDGALQQLQDSPDQARPIMTCNLSKNGASHVCGVRRQYPTGVRGVTRTRRCVCGSSCSSFFVSAALSGRAHHVGARGQVKTERVEQKERITWSKQDCKGV